MVHSDDRYPEKYGMAGFTYYRGIDVLWPSSRSGDAIMTGDAATADTGMIEGGGYPALCAMTGITF
jgi:hypothetical protein